MPPSVTIRERAATCVDLFAQAILLLAQTESSDDQNGLLDEFGRFKLWTSNIGVFADLHSSLDYRLREFNDVKDSFTRQLITVENRLQQLLDAAQQDLSKAWIKEDEDKDGEPGISAPTKSTTAATFQDWNNTQLLHSIHQSIDWLHRLSNLVRKASFANQHKRADKFKLKDEDNNDMSDTLTDYYTKLIKREFSGMQETLVQRLAASMLVRRRRIMYRRSQQQRWKIPQVEPKTKSLKLATPSTKSVLAPLAPNVPIPNNKLVVSKPEGIITAPSRLTITTIDTNIRRRVSAPSGISKGSTAPLNEQSMLLVPPPPKEVNLGEDFVCDYCCLILPSKIALNQNAWADHVNKDLYPYVCVVDKCDDPIEIYTSRKEWLAHMSTRHLMRWYCIAKPHTQPLEFDSENGFIEHMKIGHPDKFRNDQLPLVAENSSRPRDSVFDDCPFCSETSDNFEEHVGLHLRDLALRSLPWPDDDERDSQLGEYMHNDNSISNENTRSTILDFVSKPANSNVIGIIDDDGGSELERFLNPRSYFCDPASLYDSPRLREQLSDKTLIRWAIKEYRGVPKLSTLVEKLETLLSDEYSQAENAAHLEEAFIIIQQLTNENSLDQDDFDDFDEQSEKPDTIHEEILRVRAQMPNIKWDKIDMDNLTLSASLRGPWGIDGAVTLIKMKILIPTEYPELKAPKFIIKESLFIPGETYRRLDQELYELAEGFVQKKQNCLETVFTYLLGEVDFNSAIPFSKNNRDFSDDSSREEDDGIPVGGSASMYKNSAADTDPDKPVRPVGTETLNTDFEIAIICMLSAVYDAVCLILDEVWDKNSKRNERDKNTYTTGRVGRHNVVVALLPYTENSTTPVATIAHFQFLNSELALLLIVGICGGLPKFHRGGKEVEILLGDVVISRRAAEFEFGRSDRFRNPNVLNPNDGGLENRAKHALYSFSRLDSTGTDLRLEMHRILFELQHKEHAGGNMLDENKYIYSNPGAIKERLFGAHCIHEPRITADDCSVCNGSPDAVCSNVCKASCQEIGCEKQQPVRRAQMPMIYFGKMASADVVVENGRERDRISDQERVIAFDRDGLGGWENFPYISIKGVCDYADGHKDKSWQNYAAITAAATAKAFLVRIDDPYFESKAAME